MIFYSPGPNYIYLGVGNAGAYEQLGYSDDTIEISTSVEHAKIGADFAAGMAGDYQMMAEEIVVSFRLSKYNETIYNLARQRLKTSLSSAPGMGLAGALGSLLGLEGSTYGLAIVSAYGSASPVGKDVFSTMTPGFVLPRAFMSGNTTQKLGIPVKMPTVMFRALAVFGGNGSPNGGSPDGSYHLFSSDFTGLNLPAPVA